MSQTQSRTRRNRVFFAGLLVAALILAGVVSYYASSKPDGLEKVAADHGLSENAQDHDLADSPLADYAVRDVDNERLSVGLSGVIGVVVTLAIGSGLFFLLRRRSGGTGGSSDSPSST